MPATKQLVYLKSRSGEFKLRDDIKSYWTDNRTGQLAVVFSKGENILRYNPDNYDLAILKKRLEPPFRVTRCSDGEVFFNVNAVIVGKPIMDALGFLSIQHCNAQSCVGS